MLSTRYSEGAMLFIWYSEGALLSTRYSEGALLFIWYSEGAVPPTDTDF